MTQSRYLCRCQDCKKMAKKGFILGDFKARHFLGGKYDSWDKTGSVGPYSAYVLHPRLVSKRKLINRRTQKLSSLYYK